MTHSLAVLCVLFLNQGHFFCFRSFSLVRKNYVRLQGGLLIMRNSIDALQWFATWAAWITARGSLKFSKGILPTMPFRVRIYDKLTRSMIFNGHLMMEILWF